MASKKLPGVPKKLADAIDRYETEVARHQAESDKLEKEIMAAIREWHENTSQVTMAKVLGISKAYINNMLSGYRPWPKKRR